MHGVLVGAVAAQLVGLEAVSKAVPGVRARRLGVGINGSSAVEATTIAC
jgi:hypothetical protein